ncbi:MAG: hypothetical protein ACYC6W_08070 [Nitrosotalea sp.]
MSIKVLRQKSSSGIKSKSHFMVQLIRYHIISGILQEEIIGLEDNI